MFYFESLFSRQRFPLNISQWEIAEHIWISDYIESSFIELLIIHISIGMAAAEITANMGNSVWDYIDLHRAKSSIFHNFYYNNEETQDMVCIVWTCLFFLCFICSKMLWQILYRSVPTSCWSDVASLISTLVNIQYLTCYQVFNNQNW